MGVVVGVVVLSFNVKIFFSVVGFACSELQGITIQPLNMIYERFLGENFM